MKRVTVVKIMAVTSLIVLLSTLLIVWGYYNYFMVHQNLIVPSTPGMSLYRSDGITSIYSGDLVTNLWAWTGTQFTVQFVIKNIGNTILATGLNVTDVPAGWTVSITGNGTLTQGNTQTVTLTAIPPTNASGTTSGDFDLWITG